MATLEGHSDVVGGKDTVKTLENVLPSQTELPDSIAVGKDECKPGRGEKPKGSSDGKSQVLKKDLEAIETFYDSKIALVNDESAKADKAFQDARQHIRAQEFSATGFLESMQRAYDHQLGMLKHFLDSMEGPGS